MDSISWAKSTDSAGDVATTSASAETGGSSAAASWHPTNVGETLETWGAGKKVGRGLVE